MHNYATVIGVIRMKKNGSSVRQIRARYGIGSSGIGLIMERCHSSPYSMNEIMAMEPKQLLEIIYPEKIVRRKKIPLPDYDAIYNKLLEKGSKTNLFYLWTDYKKGNPDGYQYTQFVEHFNRYVMEHHATKNVSMAVERIPGEKVYIDWL